MDQYRVYGNPIKQSRSPFIHQLFAESAQQRLNYQSEFVALDGFNEKIKQLIDEQGKGANITAPFKEQALAICDRLSERARLAGAVNTLSIINGQIHGDNTDGLGLVQDLVRNDVNLKDSKILLLGAGGAAKGVVLPLLEKQPEIIVIANRTVSKAEDICEQYTSVKYKGKLKASSFTDVENDKFDIIINATSASLTGSVPPISVKLIRSDVVCYDMVYSKELTPFLLWAKSHSAEYVIDGLGMLVGQAAESFEIWRGVKPEVESVITQLRKSLAAE